MAESSRTTAAQCAADCTTIDSAALEEGGRVASDTTGRLWAPGWWGTARLRLEVFDELDGMPAAELARLLGVAPSTVARYKAGGSTPEGGRDGGGPLDRLAELLGRPAVQLLEFRPLEPDQRPHHASWSPCPGWCDDHDLLVVRRQGLPGEVDVLHNSHRHRATRGPFTVRIRRFGDADPADSWSRTLVDVHGLDAAGIRTATGADLDWLCAELESIRERVEVSS